MQISEAPELFYTIKFSEYELETLYKISKMRNVDMKNSFGLSLGEIARVNEFNTMLRSYVERKR